MKKNLLAVIVLLSILYGCSERNGNNDPLQSLEGTQWKLVGIVDETGSLKELELGPELGWKDNREKCYTLVFKTDSTFLTFTLTNDLGGGYIADYETYSFLIPYFGGTKVGELGDGRLYSGLFWHGHIQSFSVSGDQLRLYYNNKKNYLLFKSL